MRASSSSSAIARARISRSLRLLKVRMAVPNRQKTALSRSTAQHHPPLTQRRKGAEAQETGKHQDTKSTKRNRPGQLSLGILGVLVVQLFSPLCVLAPRRLCVEQSDIIR